MNQKLRIIELQDKKNVSNIELANRLNVSKELVSYWRSGKRTPPISTLEDLSSALDVKLIELIEAPSGYIHDYDPHTGEWLGIRKK